MNWLGRFVRRGKLEAQLDSELRFHVEQRTADLISEGVEPVEARRRAMIEFGGVESAREQCREARGTYFLEGVFQDVRYALRTLRKSPGFTTVAILTLALGIGANTAVFSVVEGVLLKPLPYPHPEQLVAVRQTAPGADTSHPLAIGPSNYFIYRAQNRVFQDIALYETDSVSVTGIGRPEQVHALDVTQGLLPILGIPPAIGRWFTAEDDSPGAPGTAVLTYAYWQSKFGGASSVVGRAIRVDGRERQIIGIMPQRFRFLGPQEPALILPLQLNRNQSFLGQFHYNAIARLKPGMTIAEADADIARMLPTVLRSFPPPPGYSLDLFKRLGLRPDVEPLRRKVVGSVSTLLWVLMGGIGIVLLIACANVADLLLVRADRRQQELAIRAALGATRGRIAAELLLESLIIGLLGSALGVALADAGLGLLLRMAPSGLPRIGEVGIDGRVLLFAFAVGMIVSLLFGSLPVSKYAGAALCSCLAEGGRSPAQSRRSHRARSVLVSGQVALAFVLLICSGLMIRSFLALTHVQSGFAAPAQLQTFRISIPDVAPSNGLAVLETERAISQKLKAIPGVSAVGYSVTLPMAGSQYHDAIWTADHAYAYGKAPPTRTFVFASPDYLRVMGTPLVAGRDFTWNETLRKIPVALVSESFAREEWGDPARAIGKRIRASLTDDWRQVIGVVGDVHYNGMSKPACSCIYFPLYDAKLDGNAVMLWSDVAYVIRTPRAGSQALLSEVRQAVWSVDAALPLTEVHTMNYFYGKSMARTSFIFVVLGVAGAMALLLAIVGLYGVVAYSVSRRTREIGIRIALGAQRADTQALVIGQGVKLVLVGLAVGIAGALGVGRVMRSLLYGVSPTDVPTFVAAATLLLVVALLACYVPARRATRIDPVVALRQE